MIGFKDILTTANFLGYYEELRKNREDMNFFDAYFPVKRVNGLNFDYIKGRGGIVTMLTPSAFDSEAIIVDRGGFDVHAGELPLFKNKMSLNEKERQELFTYLSAKNNSAVNNVVANIFNDEASLYDMAVQTQEVLRAKAFQDGKITMNYNGVKVDADYGFTTEQRITQNWHSPTAPILTFLAEEISKYAERVGVYPNRMLMNTSTFVLLKKNTEIINQLKAMLQNAFSDSAVKMFIQDTLGLEIIIHDKLYKDVKGASNKFVPDDQVTIFYATPMGETLCGTSPTEFDAMNISNTVDVMVTSEGIAIAHWNTVDPISLFTGVEMVCLPSFPRAEYILALDTSAPALMLASEQLSVQANAETKSTKAKKVEEPKA